MTNSVQLSIFDLVEQKQFKTFTFKGRNINVSKEYKTYKIKTAQPVDKIMWLLMRSYKLSTLQLIKEVLND